MWYFDDIFEYNNGGETRNNPSHIDPGEKENCVWGAGETGVEEYREEESWMGVYGVGIKSGSSLGIEHI